MEQIQQIEQAQRNNEIYRLRVDEKHTLQKIADKYDMTRERVRQIVVKVEAKKEREIYLKEKLNNRPEKLCDLILSKRLENVLRNEDLIDMPIDAFIDYAEQQQKTFTPGYMRRKIFFMRRFPNFGRTSQKELYYALKKLGYEDIEFFMLGSNI